MGQCTLQLADHTINYQTLQRLTVSRLLTAHQHN